MPRPDFCEGELVLVPAGRPLTICGYSSTYSPLSDEVPLGRSRKGHRLLRARPYKVTRCTPTEALGSAAKHYK